MEANNAALRAEELLSDSRWIRGIARSLVSDASAADDLVQDAWVAALAQEHPARDDFGSQRPWLARVVRNLAGKHWRSSVRRAHREETCAARETVASTAELVARAETQRLVVGAVLALNEPYRTAILLAYVEGLTSVEIARSLEVSESTVRWRIHRGLSILRFELERRRGREWLASCAVLLHANRAGALSASKITGLLVVPKAATVSLLAVVLACGSAVTWCAQSSLLSASENTAQWIAPTSQRDQDADSNRPTRGADKATSESVALLDGSSVNGPPFVADNAGNIGLQRGGEIVPGAYQHVRGEGRPGGVGAYLVLDVDGSRRPLDFRQQSVVDRIGAGEPVAFQPSVLGPPGSVGTEQHTFIGLPVVAER